MEEYEREFIAALSRVGASEIGAWVDEERKRENTGWDGGEGKSLWKERWILTEEDGF